MTEQEKARSVAELLAAWADGKALQFISSVLDGGVWSDYKDSTIPVNLIYSNINNWRIKPNVKKEWCRIAFLNDASLVIAHNETQEIFWSERVKFLRWITDRIEYEYEVKE